MSRRFPIKPVAAAVLAALVANGPVFAAADIDEQVTIAPGRQISSRDETVISSAAAKVLGHIAAARGELQGDKPNTDKAGQELDQTEKLLDIIQAALPTTKIKDRIWVAKKHLEYEDTHQVLPDLVRIYTALDELMDYMPTSMVKSHLDEAKRALAKGDRPKARAQLDATNDALIYAEAELPVGSTRYRVAQARAALKKGDSKAADQALVAAEDNVVFLSLLFRAPLTQAKAALWRAWQDYNLGENDFAKADLGEAVKCLEQAAESEDQVERMAADDLLGQVRDLHQLIDVGDKGFVAKLESSWHRLKALSERSAEYIRTGRQRLRAEGAGKKDLIEAKLQLAYARIDHFYSKDDAAAKVDLAEAKGYLDAAAGQSKPDTKAKVEAVASLVKRLKQGIDSNKFSAGDTASFQQAEGQLATLIRQL